ncbi:hypothetical protein [uncultured Acetobacteroides sp.]|uniref:hypothetical protein n=1 Tax=uncultured Acetobacteroides sp. TaxID=1760811 RepID=UPI0029F5718B|nr:hypothetical protein [uncultured Acetobacteroides sp.]
MRYYRVKIVSIFNTPEGVLGHANGEYVLDGKQYFYRMGKGEVVMDAPVFDYFHLQSYGPQKNWEWRLQDVHGFIGEYPTGGCWYISDRLKQLLGQFKIGQGYHFYPTKLLFRGDKLDYWIFQYAIHPLQNINFGRSFFHVEGEEHPVEGISTWQEYEEFDIQLYNQSKRSHVWDYTTFNSDYDFLYYIVEGDILVSERLRDAIEKTGIEGLEFKEVSYMLNIP